MKVKLEKRQWILLDDLLRQMSKDDLLKAFHHQDLEKINRYFIYDFDIVTLAKALYIGYEKED